jgi:uncharacterized protein YbjT (DUF2867 family)
MRILVTGAGGFVGSLLVPRLLAAGHEVRGLSREPARLRSQAELMRGDALSGAGLAEALDGVELAYYLIHSMEQDSPARGSGARGERGTRAPQTFEQRDRIAAERFATAAQMAGVRRIVYLGGLQGDGRGSRHLSSRHQVEQILMDRIADSVSLRASIVIGARSRSFRLLVHLVERMRILALPPWRRYRTQPIDERDVTAMLLACATAPIGGRSLDIGGRDVLSYGAMIERIAELMLVSRPSLGFGLSMTGVTARVAAAIAGEDPGLVVPLMESLEGDLLPADDRASELLGVELHSFDAAVEHALREWEESEQLVAR